MSLGDRLVALAKQHMGLAASAYVTAELRAIDRSRAQLDAEALRELARRARTSAARFMDPAAVEAFGRDIEALADGSASGPAQEERVDHKLALDAAATLLARGDVHRALLAYTELAERHGDVSSYRGLIEAAMQSGQPAVAVAALRDGSLKLIQQGQRDEAMSLLEEAVALVPTDLAVHRRLVAVYANAGDATSAKCEHARFVEACLAAGELDRARGELEYARQTVGDSPALRELEHWVATGKSPRAAVKAERVVPRAVLSVVKPVVEPAVSSPRPAAPRLTVVASAPPPSDLTAEERALAWIGRRDPRAEQDVIAAARELIDARKTRAAADLLVAYIASGLPSRDAQRLLIGVERALDRPDLATEKAHLLSRLLELDGDTSGAVEVERLSLAS